MQNKTKNSSAKFHLKDLFDPVYIVKRVKTANSSADLLKKGADLLVLVWKIITFRYGQKYWEKLKQEKALRYIKDANKINDTDVHLDMGRYFFDKEDYEKAKSAFEKVAELDRSSKSAYFGIGEINYRTGKFEEAVRNFTKSIELDKENKKAHRFLGSVFAKKKEYDKALAEYDKAVTLTEGDNVYDSEVYMNMSEIYIEQAKPEKAVESLGKAIELDKENKRAYELLVQAYKNTKQYDKALDVLETLLVQCNKNTELEKYVYKEKADIYYATADHDRAAAELKKIVKIDPDDLEARFFSGEIFKLKGRYKEALEEFGKVIDLCGNNKALGAKAYECRVEICELCENYSLMIEDISKLLSANPASVNAYLTLSRAYRLKGQEEESKEAFDKAVKLIKNEKHLEMEKPDPDKASGLKEKNSLLNRSEIAQGKSRLLSRPRRISVVLTDRCNLHCRMCPNKSNSCLNMPKKVKDEVLGLFPYLEEITWLGGEVFLDPDFDVMFDVAAGYRIKQIIITNALLLNEEYVEKFIKNDVDLSVSIDGITKEVYEYIRRGAKFETLIKKLELINKVRKNINPGYKLALNAVVMRANWSQLDGFAEFAKTHNFNSLNLSMVSGNLDDQNIFNFNRDEKVLSDIGKAIDSLSEKCKLYGIDFKTNITKSVLRPAETKTNGDIKSKDVNTKTSASSEKVICTAPWESLNIDNYGVVQPIINCFCAHVVGNLNTHTMEDVWNGERMIEYREDILRGAIDKVCGLKKIYNGIPWELFAETVAKG